MRRSIVILLCLVSSIAFAQRPTNAKPEDVKSIDSIVAALYSSISDPTASKMSWDRFESLFTDSGRLIAVGAREDDAIIHGISPAEYVKLSGPYIEQEGFSERELARKTEQFANIAQVVSTYESKLKGSDKPLERGINLIQLFNDGKRWWIVSVTWQKEDEDNPLPAKYLPGGKPAFLGLGKDGGWGREASIAGCPPPN
ncbi:MAG TPA: hypothetical protein VMI31_06660 [Fimbriimonadaceae bacterium]|nr:hypothetical protein [Fimbriimonadaceae bacterium]